MNEETAIDDLKRIRIMCVDDHPIFRQGLAAIIESERGLELVAAVGSGEEALAAFKASTPDVTLMDMRLPGISGVAAIDEIRKHFADARIIVLTTETGDAQIHRALEAGAKGYVLKGTAMSELIETIRAVAAGKTRIPDLVASHLAEHIGHKKLSARETEVLGLIAKGFRNRAVAEALSIGEETVKMHVKNCMAKLDARDRTHAVTIAIQRGFIVV